MDYYRDPDSIKAAAAVRRCLSLLTEQAKLESQPRRSLLPDSHEEAHAVEVESSRPATGRSMPVHIPSRPQKETIMQAGSAAPLDSLNLLAPALRADPVLYLIGSPTALGRQPCGCGQSTLFWLSRVLCADEAAPGSGIEGSRGGSTQISGPSSAQDHLRAQVRSCAIFLQARDLPCYGTRVWHVHVEWAVLL